MKNRFFLIILLVSFSSCNKEKTFPFVVVNTSPYDIDAMMIEGTVDRSELSIKAMDTSSVLLLSYKRRFRISPKNLRVNISTYHYGADKYQNGKGKFIPFNNKDLNTELNFLVIEDILLPDTTTNIFEVTLN